MAQKIEFDTKSQHAMFSLLRFLHHTSYIDNGNSIINMQKTIADFKDYVEKNEIESKSIVKCNCTEDITIEEAVFNVCYYCKGMPYKPYLMND
ncbi:hypothetical protein L1265_11925 [Tenacibaculum sp. Cn5-1]|uniref:hypothetical protein n=2 Tax=Tenacibaculum TaxID=104267 RepID=UPI001EF8C9E5|nr:MULTISPECIES: hypothetical protein [unclassified Tenacibaculum]MCF2875416.1 hypothetical protein [Tenacibaculum sp. Cn5-1]